MGALCVLEIENMRGGAIRGTLDEQSRLTKVRVLGQALQQLLNPTESYLPVIPQDALRKVEILTFGLDRAARMESRDAIESFGLIIPVTTRDAQGRRSHRAWIVQPESRHQLSEVLVDDIAPTPSEEEASTAGPEVGMGPFEDEEEDMEETDDEYD